MDKKSEKKAKKLKDEIDRLETQLRESLGKKDSSTVEIDVSAQMRRITERRAELEKLS